MAEQNGAYRGAKAEPVAGVTTSSAAGRDPSLFSSVFENELLKLITEVTILINLLNPTNCVSQPLSSLSRRVLRSQGRKLFLKLLDAPEKQDNFYQSLVEWLQNVLSAVFGACTCLWAAVTRRAKRLREFVTSVAYGQCDVTTSKVIHPFDHSGQVGALAWNGDLLASGSRNRIILQKNIRTPPSIPQRRLLGRRQEVCGLKWSSDNQLLASGGNFNKLFDWGLHSVAPLQTFMEHIAAVKAIKDTLHHTNCTTQHTQACHVGGRKEKLESTALTGEWAPSLIGGSIDLPSQQGRGIACF